MKRIDVTIHPWEGYELLDSGEGRKLERFGDLVLDRPDTQALWTKTHPNTWLTSDAQFVWADKGERWKIAKGAPENWNITWSDVSMNLSFKGFKHVGIFPEHSAQWHLLQQIGKDFPGTTMLNLFGYTGAASIAAAKAGMKVTHVDASKQTIQIVKDNAARSSVAAQNVKVVVEDTLKYVKRLIARGEQFDVLTIDPPAFGRGPKGEVWKIEESLAELVSLIPKLVSPDAKMVVLNGYASGYSARTFGELLQEAFPKESIVYGDIGIAQNQSDRILSTGIYSMWRR